METMEKLNISIRPGRKNLLPLLVLFFLCWHPGYIGSESLTLTTYYPAPYGGYVTLLTTGQTLLARDAGNVGIGTGATTPAQKLHVMGNIQADRLKFPGVGSNSGITGDYYSIYQEAGAWANPYPDLRIQYHTGITYDAYQGYGGHRFFTGYDGSGNPPPGSLQMQITNGVNVLNDLTVGGNLTLSNKGMVYNACSRVGYGVGGVVSCPADPDGIRRMQVMGFMGDGVARVTGFLPRTGTTSSVGTYIVLGEDWGGTMMCCRFN